MSRTRGLFSVMGQTSARYQSSVMQHGCEYRLSAPPSDPSRGWLGTATLGGRKGSVFAAGAAAVVAVLAKGRDARVQRGRMPGCEKHT